MIGLLTAFALAFSMSGTVFAAQTTCRPNASYDNGQITVEGYGIIQAKSTNGHTLINGTSSGDMYTEVAAEVKYYPQNMDDAPVTQRVYDANSGALSEVTYSNSSCYQFRYATYSFYADVPTSYGVQSFSPDDITLEYP